MNIKRTDREIGNFNEKEDKYLKLKKKQNKINHKRIKRNNKQNEKKKR